MATAALISTSAIPTPPVNYGGIERSAAWLVKGLENMGHHVYCFCAPGSTIKCTQRYFADTENGFVHQMVGVLSHSSFDVIIDMSHDKPVAREFHGQIPQINNWQGRSFTWSVNPVFLSKAQAAHLGRPDAPVIYHGPDYMEYPVNLGRPKGGPLLYLGAVTRHKSPHLVAEAAVKLGREAIICGPTWDKEYWPEIERMKTMPGVKVINEVGGQDKIDLMHSCSVLVHPVGAHGWMEAGALVVLEAMLMGIPVVGTPNGCLPEYIVDGKTGYLADDTPESIANAVKLAERLSPVAVLSNYDYSRTMNWAALEYTRLIDKVMTGETW
jgi:glycosyltransferase involved in cell wall biosynthesis